MLQFIDTRINYVAPMVCAALKNSVAPEHFIPQGTVSTVKNIEDTAPVVDKHFRYVMSGTEFKSPELVNSVIQHIVENFIEPSYHCTVQYWEWPQLLSYPNDGGHYLPHVDAEFYDQETGQWNKISNRDITLLIYLDEDYEGGEVIFPNHNITVRPKTGQIITFPSNRYFMHGVNPVVGGERNVLVCWLTVFGSNRISPFPPKVRHVLRGEYSSFKRV